MARLVNNFNNEILGVIEEAKQRVEAGTGTDEEIIRIEGQKRMEIIFKLYSEDLIGNYGFYHSENDIENHLSQLSKIISKKFEQDDEYIEFLISSLYDSGLLKYKQNGKNITCLWTHNNKTDFFDYIRVVP